mmetsp:Transcript_31137/g.29982  ORF Transcript_31137/g.29982 Transcript_31137/m.29982 type:complete len:130 (-) Transcript_31137:313-702(-)|eukprot:CAMPEP_0197828040 /NCGR_PEP_ID=MMETSP1437-20131217/4688_1 /TAXON_ID=49252 ORGANISM="Eucampia antarctica, Strain CCMP1452" /NCGR_SAMPLE_ID=MMETSP1437 /ASSEMBLY_ACC=CAM_ASM_001096 /LENGTH=129 /DNA_ID=CAMNT_0043429113 /DNA_START=40 /DNA_END=429 /DNA_ORIENTATION=+
MASLNYQKHCLTEPVLPSIMFGGVFSALDTMRGIPFTPQGVVVYVGGIYVYSALQCPMEAMSGGRKSWMHNVLSGGTLGYLGVQSGRMGIPFVGSRFLYRYPQLSPPMVAFAVYGGMGGLFAAIGGKPF